MRFDQKEAWKSKIESSTQASQQKRVSERFTSKLRLNILSALAMKEGGKSSRERNESFLTYFRFLPFPLTPPYVPFGIRRFNSFSKLIMFD